MAIFYPTGGAGSGVGSDECTALQSQVLAGVKAVTADSEDEAVEGTLEVQSVINFNVAQYSSLTLLASWALPAKGPWSGLRVMCKQGNYPVSPDDGALFYEGSAASATKALAAGTWYFRAWDYMSTNYGRMYGSYHDGTASNVQIKGQQVFTSSVTWYVPAGVRSLDIFTVGAGGGGGHGTSRLNGGGGGGGYTNTVKSVAVTPGQALVVIIGSGFGNQGAGGNTYVSRSGVTLITAAGGQGGRNDAGGSGGSGGGTGGGYAGGADGANGGGWTSKGQGRTTRAFGESSNTLYAGGGGGGKTRGAGAGGVGGGGKGSDGTTDPTAGTPGTGGGAGGGCTAWYSGAVGGSGIAIIRWGY